MSIRTLLKKSSHNLTPHTFNLTPHNLTTSQPHRSLLRSYEPASRENLITSNMKYFLEIVAHDIYQKFNGHLEQVVVVFPNKRARLFFNSYLADIADKPLWTPQYTTISEFVQAQSSYRIPDNIYLVCKLFQAYQQIMPDTEETLDDFFAWGQVLLADFDDIDKNLVNTQQLFANLENLHELDSEEYLTESQKDALKYFFHMINDRDTEVKRRFRQLWKYLPLLYKQFNDILKTEGYLYEGALYREVVQNGLTLDKECYAFVGFNLLPKAEQQLLQIVKNQGKAKFYWDIDQYYIQPTHEAARFLNKYMQNFPNEIPLESHHYNNLLNKKQITFIAANTETAQARYALQWLNHQKRVQAGRKTAIVLCNEQLLPTLLHAIPDSVDKLNITAGIQISTLPIASLLTLLYQLHTKLIQNKSYLQRRYVRQLACHPLAQLITPHIQEVKQYLLSNHYPLIQLKDIAFDQTLQQLFLLTPPTSHLITSHLTPPNSLLQWLIAVIQQIGINAKDSQDILLKESIFQTHNILQRLHTLFTPHTSHLTPHTLHKLIRKILAATKIPFHGEPAVGLQIMGLLETRNLDFDHLLILSCNEGNLPPLQNTPSIIPHSLRKAFAMTTSQHIDSLYSYYFHRLIQRATEVTLLYNQATSETNKAEMSRYMLQLLADSRLHIQRQAISLHPSGAHRSTPQTVPKNPTNMKVLYQNPQITPSDIATYLRCPLSFYYQRVIGLRDNTHHDNPTDPRLFGDLFHHAAQNLHQQAKDSLLRFACEELTPQQYAHYLKQANVEKAVDHALRHYRLLSPSGGQRGVTLISRRVLVKYLKRMQHIDTQIAPATVKYTEQPIQTTLQLTLNTQTPKHPNTQTPNTITLFGIIDRIDQPDSLRALRSKETPPTPHPSGGDGDGYDCPSTFLRVIDYKTGKPDSQMDSLTLQQLFQPESIDKHSNYVIQTLLYSIMLAHDKELNPHSLPVMPSIYYVRRFRQDLPLATVCLDKKAITNVTEIEHEFLQQLRSILQEIYAPHGAFAPTTFQKRCQNCDFRGLCYN